MRRFAVPIPAGLILGLLTLLLTACHDKGETAAPVQTMPEYVHSADTACGRTESHAEALTPPDDERDVRAWARYADSALSLLRPEQAQLTSLAGVKIQGQVAGFLGHVRRRVELAQSLSWAAHAGDVTGVRFELLELRTERTRISASAKALNLTACAGSSTSVTPIPSPAGGGRLSHPQYLQAADELCAETAPQIQALTPATTLPGLASYLGRALTALRALQQRLTALRPPSADTSAVKTLNTQKQAVLTAMARARAGAADGDASEADAALAGVKQASAKYRSTATHFGLKTCA